MSENIPEEIFIPSNHPNADDFVYVAGRCYSKTNEESTDFQASTENVFSGMLDYTDMEIVNPMDDIKSDKATRTGLSVKKFTDCNNCGDFGDRYRGQFLQTYRDYYIKVIKEIDEDSGGKIVYKFNGEDRNGHFNLDSNRDFVFYINDSVIFDISCLEEPEKFTIAGITTEELSDGKKIMLGKTRNDPMIASIEAHKTSSLPEGEHSYSESGNADITGKITIEENKYELNPEYNTNKLKQFPHRLHIGHHASHFIRNDGKVFSVGHNDNFNLGTGRDKKTDSRRTSLTTWNESRINEIGPIKKVFGNHVTTGYLTYENKMYLVGYNGTGNLARGNTTNSPVPELAQIDHDQEQNIYLSEDIHTQIVDADAGVYHGVALDVNQRLWAWGQGGIYGATIRSMNHPSYSTRCVAYDTLYEPTGKYQDIQGNTCFNRGRKVLNKCKLVYWSDDVAKDTNSADITDKNLFGLNIPGNKLYQVACGRYNTFILTLDGAVYSCGYNTNGELGQSRDTKPGDIAISDHPHPSFGLIAGTGGKLTGDDSKIWVKKIIAGAHHTLLLTYDDKLYGFGSNTNHRLGIDITEFPKLNSPKFLADNVYDAFAGPNSSAYIRKDGKVFVCGSNINGKLGIDRFEETAPVPSEKTSSTEIETWTESPRLTGLIEIKMSSQHSIALLTDGQIVGLGDNSNGALGTQNRVTTTTNANTIYENKLDTDKPESSNTLFYFGREVNFDKRVPSIFCGPYTTYLNLHDAIVPSIEVAGRNHVGQAGFTSDPQPTTKKDLTNIDSNLTDVLSNNATIKEISCTANTVGILNSKGELWGFGYSRVSNLLQTSDSRTPIQITYKDEPLERVQSFSFGVYHGVAVDGNNRLYAWGQGGIYGATIRSMNHPSYSTRCVAYDTLYEPTGKYQDIQGNTCFNRGRVQITSPILLNDGEDRCFPDYVGKISDVKCSFYNTYILNEDGELFSCGYNTNGELGQRRLDKYGDIGHPEGQIHDSFGRVFSFNGTLDARVKRVIPGPHTCFVILEDNTLYGWGANGSYQLGKSELNTQDKIHRDKYDYPVYIDSNVEDVFTGNYNTAIKKQDGTIYVMGRNSNGLLANFGDGRELGLDRYDSVNGLKPNSEYAKIPIAWFEADDNITEIAFGYHHSVIKQIDRSGNTAKLIYYSAGSNQYGERGTGRDTGGTAGTWDTTYDNETRNSSNQVEYPGSDRWVKIKTINAG